MRKIWAMFGLSLGSWLVMTIFSPNGDFESTDKTIMIATTLICGAILGLAEVIKEALEQKEK